MAEGVQILPEQVKVIPTNHNNFFNPANTRSYVVFLALIYFATRMVFCFLNEAEFTDAYIMFNWSWDTTQRWHPLYPGLIKLLTVIFQDPITAGRFISVLCGALAIVALSKLTKEIYDLDTAFLCALLAIASPQFLWANTRVLTESLFIAISAGTILFSYRALHENKLKDSFMAIFLSGLAILTRPDGIILLPCALWSSIHVLKTNKNRLRSFLLQIPALSSWLIFFIWFRGKSSETTYEGVLLYSLTSSSLSRILLFFVTYLENYPYSLTYPVFLAALFSLGFTISTSRRIWLLILAYLHVAVFCMVAVHGWWSSRFLILVLVMVLPESAFFLIVLKAKSKKWIWKTVMITTILFSFLFAIVGTYLQKDTYKDFKISTEYIREHFPNSRIISDETYKVPFYLRRDIIRYPQQEPLQKGDILVLHSFHTPLQTELKYLSDLYDFRVLFVSRARTMPVLTNSLLESVATTGTAITSLKRFDWQRFESIVIQIGDMKKPE
jgi:dolichyl-phosphate-mannose-protein mannosyltransferase